MPIEPKKQRKHFSIDDRGKESIKKFANKEEKSVADSIGAKLQPNSGATPFLKGDMITTDYCIDVKSTKSSQIIVDEDMLTKVESDAVRVGKTPALLLNFPKSERLRRKRWVLLPLE